ncbi:MAG: hypothetical protein AAFO07_08410 [Bacteroidota bacterium]
MKVSDIELLRRFIINTKTDKALEGLLKLIDKSETKMYNQVLLLYADYNAINEKMNLGLGNYSTDKNRINLALLEVLSSLEQSASFELEEVESSSQTEFLKNKLIELESKVELILELVEKLNESILSKFLKEKVFKLLKPQTQNHLISLVAVEKESHDYNFLISGCYKILELEFGQSVFFPLKEEIKLENPELDKKTLLAKLEGDQKLEFYEFMIDKRKDFTTRQMANFLADNLNHKYNTKSNQYNFVFYFLLRNYIILNRWQLEKDLRALVEVKIDKKLNNILFAKADYERIRGLTLKILRNIQPRSDSQ